MIKIHPAAIIEDGVKIGEGAGVLDNFEPLNPRCIINLIDAQRLY